MLSSKIIWLKKVNSKNAKKFECGKVKSLYYFIWRTKMYFFLYMWKYIPSWGEQYNNDVFGPLPSTMGDIPNRPKMTTKN